MGDGRVPAVPRRCPPKSVPAGTRAPGVSQETPTMAQQQADALALLAKTALHHGVDPGALGERYQVVVLADADQAGQSVLEDGLHVPAGTSQRLACDASRVVMRHAPDGRVVEVGARTRTIPPALRRALHHRDRISPCCVAGTTAPCTRRATGWSDKPTASYTSGVRTGGACPRCRLPPRRPPIPSRPSGGCTRHGGSASTRGPRPRGGWGDRLDVGWAIDVLHPLAG